MKRRKFLNHLGAISTGLVCGGSFLPKSFTEDTVKVTILHTNDTHSRIDPFPDYAGKLAGKGGAAARSAYIKAVRSNEEHVLLLDAGDIWQGTPYFNTYKGRLEFELMSKMKYDAATLGNHDFDLGIEGLKAQWDVADFPFICTNYDFSDTALEGLTQNYIIIKKSKIKIGILGVGIQLDGLVPDSLFSGLRYLDPVQQANHMARKLKRDMDCDFVITLSHLGYQYTSDKISDRKLARHSEYIDLIIGGHTHTFLDGIQVVKNKKGEDVAINQVGHGGAMIGHIDLWFDGNKKKRSKDCQNCWV
jgi:5'-nucleotidase